MEQHVHKALRNQREGKEWFRCDFSQAVQTIYSCYQGRIYYEQCFKEEREAELEQARIEQELFEQMLREEQQRQEEARKHEERVRQLAEERRRAQELEQIRKKAAEEEEQRKQSYIFKRKNRIFIQIIIITYSISAIIGCYFKSLFMTVLLLVASSIWSLTLAAMIKERDLKKWENEYEEIKKLP